MTISNLQLYWEKICSSTVITCSRFFGNSPSEGLTFAPAADLLDWILIDLLWRMGTSWFLEGKKPISFLLSRKSVPCVDRMSGIAESKLSKPGICLGYGVCSDTELLYKDSSGMACQRHGEDMMDNWTRYKTLEGLVGRWSLESTPVLPAVRSTGCTWKLPILRS